MTATDEKPVPDQVCEEELREGARNVAEAALRQYGPGAVTRFREIAAKAEADGRETRDGFLMFAEEAEKLLAEQARA